MSLSFFRKPWAWELRSDRLMMWVVQLSAFCSAIILPAQSETSRNKRPFPRWAKHKLERRGRPLVFVSGGRKLLAWLLCSLSTSGRTKICGRIVTSLGSVVANCGATRPAKTTSWRNLLLQRWLLPEKEIPAMQRRLPKTTLVSSAWNSRRSVAKSPAVITFSASPAS